jgi:hypothetical protein
LSAGKYAAKNVPAIFGDLRETGTSFVSPGFQNDARAQLTCSLTAELAQKRLPFRCQID